MSVSYKEMVLVSILDKDRCATITELIVTIIMIFPSHKTKRGI